MGVPPDMEVMRRVHAPRRRPRLPAWEADPRTGIVLTGDVETMAALARTGHPVKRINVGGIHPRPGRRERLRYVFLTDDEAAALQQLAARGVEVTAQDVPTARPVPMEEFT